MLLFLSLKWRQVHLRFGHYNLIAERALLLIDLQVFGRCKELPITTKNALLLGPLPFSVVRFCVRFLANILDQNRVLLHVLAWLELHLFQILFSPLHNQLLDFWSLSFNLLASACLLKPVSPSFSALGWYILHLLARDILLGYSSRLF